MKSFYYPKPDLILEEEKGEAILFDPDSLLTAWLNQSGISIWKALVKGKTPLEIKEWLKSVLYGSRWKRPRERC